MVHRTIAYLERLGGGQIVLKVPIFAIAFLATSPNFFTGQFSYFNQLYFYIIR